MQSESRAPFDPNLKYKVRDFVWTLLFILYVGGMVFISRCTVSMENINRVRYGSDSDGNVCGTVNKRPDGSILDLTGLPYAFFMDGHNLPKSKIICVSKCPEKSTYWSDICSYLDNDSRCVVGYPSKPNLFASDPSSTLSSKNWKKAEVEGFLGDRTPLESFPEAIADSWDLIVISLGIATFLAILWLFFIPFISTLVVWITIWVTLLISKIATAYAWGLYYEVATNTDLSFIYQIDFFAANEKLLLCLASSFSILLVFISFFMLSCYKRMDLSIQLIDESSNLLQKVQLVFLVPIVNYVLIMALFSLAIVVVSILIFCKDQVFFEASAILALINCFLIYFLFGLVWVWNVIDAVCDSIIGGAIAEWYWTPASVKDKHVSNSVTLLFRSTIRTLYYSFGSIVMGSLMISFLLAIRYMLEFIKKKLEGVEYRLIRLVLSATQFILFFIEKFVAYMNRAGYIHMAMYNSSYVDSVHSVANLLSRNSFRSFVLGWITFLVLFIAKSSITLVAVSYAAQELFVVSDSADVKYYFKSTHVGTALVWKLCNFLSLGCVDTCLHHCKRVCLRHGYCHPYAVYLFS
ncbi:solute carrier family 44 protein member 2 [Mitosporidium daphniae]|uniref:Protein PNS1 n=1 Tax=Mitosporidium daphniae TaxID=1485682 RepID=A0A098VVV8_9MICR|nr:solute carrier family 44 protein member 2 [Mitosporidium daphniae]KGG51846.1 solute carrier family 44 protein member 2 [Mitosporidium daphniae]|eukprot:XP_013238300.1 solute carrier family 44 protein member 2 [Mitosporidium daphniae]